VYDFTCVQIDSAVVPKISLPYPSILPNHAEGAMDRHNMMLFLMNDTNKQHPAGFEVSRRNIFDPEEDPVICTPANSSVGETAPNGSKDEDTTTEKKVKDNKCSRQGCNLKPRFDSRFCSDSCGVACLERDLLESLKYANKLHPSVLRGDLKLHAKHIHM